MRYFSDVVVLICLLSSGLLFGNYCKFAYTYDNLWIHWYALVGAVLALCFAVLWTCKKRKQQQYSFDHFWLIVYGLVCQVISCCFMLTENMDVAFYFGFIGLGAITLPSYSLLSLRSDSDGSRPSRIALGNAVYCTGITVGFSVFNEFAPQLAGWLLLGVCVASLAGCVLNEALQHLGANSYKCSRDRVFNLLNEERLVFQSPDAIHAQFATRTDFYTVRSRQGWAMAAAMVLVLERLCFGSPTLLQLTWSATFASLERQHLYLPFALYAAGCYVGAALLLRYKTKLIYLLFALIKVTALAAVLGVYADNRSEDCFYFLCIYYISMGVYASVALQMILECAPFLYTELLLTVAFALELGGWEVLKYETLADDNWNALMGVSLAAMMLALIGVGSVQLLMPQSRGLVEMRNKLIGLRRHHRKSLIAHSKASWPVNNYLPRGLEPHALRTIKLPGNRVFLQYCGSERTPTSIAAATITIDGNSTTDTKTRF